MPAQSSFASSSARSLRSASSPPREASAEVNSGDSNGPHGMSISGPAHPAQAIRAAARMARRMPATAPSDLVLIDVALLLDIRFFGALQRVGIELLVPPYGPPLFLVL